jgi:predicted Zn-dependent protease
MRRSGLFLVALMVAGAPFAADPPQPEGAEVKKSRLLLLPKSRVEAVAAQQYNQLMRGAAQKGALNADRRQVERLRGIARRLIPHTVRFDADAGRWRWEVNLVHSPTVNAFCMPGGKIAFFSGLTDGLRLSDDEIAVIMGHEMSHALLEHGRARMSEQVLKAAGVNIAAALLNLSNVSASLLAQAADLALTLPYARSQETDADLAGIEIAARAGYDPRAAVAVWRKMSALSGPRGQPPQFLSTHPAHAERIRNIEVRLPRVMPLYESARRAQAGEAGTGSSK